MSPRLRAPCRGICLCGPFEFHRVLQTSNFQTIAPIHWPVQGSISEDWLGSADVPAGQCAEPPIALGVGDGSPQGCPRAHGQLHAVYACACMSVVPCRAKSKDPRWPTAIVAVAAIRLASHTSGARRALRSRSLLLTAHGAIPGEDLPASRLRYTRARQPSALRRRAPARGGRHQAAAGADRKRRAPPAARRLPVPPGRGGHLALQLWPALQLAQRRRP